MMMTRKATTQILLLFTFVTVLLAANTSFAAVPSSSDIPVSEDGMLINRGTSPDYIYNDGGLTPRRTKLLYLLIIGSSLAGVALLAEMFRHTRR